MAKFIPFEKLSKKKQKELNAARRGSWHGVNPVSRKSENPKAYNRQKARKWSEDIQDRAFNYIQIKKVKILRQNTILIYIAKVSRSTPLSLFIVKSDLLTYRKTPDLCRGFLRYAET